MKKMNLIKKIVATATISALSISMLAGTAVAGQFVQDEKGVRYQNDDGTFATQVWKWLDIDGDGTFLSYAFDENGYLYSNTTTPDGYTAGADGSWIENGIAVVRTAAENLDPTPILDAATKTAQMVAQVSNKASQAAVDAINGINTTTTTEDKILKVRQLTTQVNASDLVTKVHKVKTVTDGAAGSTSTEDNGPDMNKTSFDTFGPSVPAEAVSSTLSPLTDSSTIGVLGPDGKASDGNDAD